MFAETMRAFPHLDESDSLLLASYITATTKVMKFSKENDTANWERAVRAQLALARSLRLTHQSRTYPQNIGRRMADRPKRPMPWEHPAACDADEGDEEE